MWKERWSTGMRYADFVASALANRDLWQVMTRRASPPPDLLSRVTAVSGQWHLLVLVEDWCGDAVSTIPLVSALAEAAPNLEMRVVGRDANPDLMDAHLTQGSRSIPVVILLDACFREVAWWGPRPAELQAWVRGEGLSLPKEDRYREVRRWYARDRGRSTLEEIVGILEAASTTRQAA
jgi:hypothetical protein